MEDITVPTFIARLPSSFEFLANSFHRLPVIEQRQDLQQSLFIQRDQPFPIRNFEEQMEVVRHQAVSHDPYPCEGFLIAKEFAKYLLFPISENPPPIYNS